MFIVVVRGDYLYLVNEKIASRTFLRTTMWKTLVLVVTLLMVTLCITPTVIEADEGATLESGPDVEINGGADLDLGKFAEGSRTDDETIAKVCE